MNTQATASRPNTSRANRSMNQAAKKSQSEAESKNLSAKPESSSTKTVNNSETAFQFSASHAKTVKLVGDFTQWDRSPIQMVKDGSGVWRAKVSLSKGRHAYRFLVDDQWMNDPVCQICFPNGFGSFNNVVEIV